jgi:hypothetical protein
MKIRAEKRKGECTQINDVETKKVFEHDETKNAAAKLVPQVSLLQVGSGMTRERETEEKTID